MASDLSEAEALKSDESYALFVGRLSEEKGIETLLQAWGQLSLPLHLIGDGPLMAKAQSVESSSIVSLGHLSSKDVGVKMAQASFLVMPSEWYEGFPMVLVEAFAHGLPVVASRLVYHPPPSQADLFSYETHLSPLRPTVHSAG